MLQAQTTKATADTAAAKSDKAARAVSDRAEMIAKLEGQTVERQRIAAAVDESAPDVGACRDQNDADSKAVAQARTDRETCDVLARLLRADVSFLRKLREMVDLGRRSEAVRGAHEVLASIQVELDKIRIDARTLAELRSADVRLKTARASLGSAMPSFRLEAFAATVVDIDGETTTVKPGAVVEKTVPAASCITVPGVISLTVMPGVTDAGLVAEAHAAERAFSDLCATTGVADVAQGEVAVSARRRLESDRVEQEQVIRSALGPVSLQDLEQQLAEISAGIDGYKLSRPKAPVIAPDLKSAELALAETEGQLELLTRLVTDAEGREEVSRRRRAALEAHANEQSVRLSVAEEALESLQSALAGARERESDKALTEAHQALARDTQVTAATAQAAQSELDLANPDEVGTLLANASQVLVGMKGDLRQAENERLEVRARLGEHGEAGLGERRDQAIAASDAAVEELRSYDRRAAARKLLFETLKSARDRVRAAYVGPLQDRVDELGRVVFGATFRICIDESLSIVSRTLGDTTIPYGSLSDGTKEQLAVIIRLACATIVAPSGGVPVILDDVLGYSDPHRLEAMGAVLSEAGRTTQVIVFTCDPDRYRQVGGAHLLRLG